MPSAARSLVSGSKPSGSRRSSRTLLSREPLRTVLLAESIGHAIISLPPSGTLSIVSGCGVAAPTVTNRSPSRGRSRAASACARAKRGATVRHIPMPSAARRPILRAPHWNCRSTPSLPMLAASLPRRPVSHIPREIWRGYHPPPLLSAIRREIGTRSGKPANPRRFDAADGSLAEVCSRPASLSCRRPRDAWRRHGLCSRHDDAASRPLPFGADLEAKPAFDAIARALARAPVRPRLGRVGKPARRFSSGGQLVADRQPPDALAGRRKDRVAEGRREGRQPRLADAARRHIDPIGDDPDMGDRRRLFDAKDLVPVEIVLLDAPVLEADLAVARQAQPHDRSTFDLRIDPLRVGGEAAIDRGVDARHGQLSLVVHRDLDDSRDVAQEAAMHGDPLAVPRRQLLAPLRLIGN